MKGRILVICFFILVGKMEAQSVLSIRSKPDSANVYINDKFFGKTPIEILNIGLGYQSITLKKDSLQNWWTLVYLKSDSSYQIYAVLDGNYGLLTLYTNPSNAKVYLNDSLIGKTPLNEHEVKAGTYDIKIKQDNYAIWENYIEITPNLKKMRVNLSCLSGTMSFNNILKNQILYLDGKPLDNHHIKNQRIPIGNHKIYLLDTKLNKQVFDNIDVGSGNHYDVFFDYDEFSFKPLLLSSIIPGLGQIYSKHYLKGTLILISTIASSYLTVLSVNDNNNKIHEYNLFQGKYLSAQNEEDASYYRLMTQNAYESVKTTSTYKNIAIGAVVGLYLYNLLDTVLFSSKLDVMHYYENNSHYEMASKIGYKSVKVGLQWKF